MQASPYTGRANMHWLPRRWRKGPLGPHPLFPLVPSPSLTSPRECCTGPGDLHRGETLTFLPKITSAQDQCCGLLPRATVWLIASCHPGCFQKLSNSDLPFFFFFFLIRKSAANTSFARVSHNLQQGCQKKCLILVKEPAEA